MAGFLFRLETAEGKPANPPTLEAASRSGAWETGSTSGPERYKWLAAGTTTKASPRCSSLRTWPDEPLRPDLTFCGLDGAGLCGKREVRSARRLGPSPVACRLVATV
jgi:hypothetical protein